jgi:hypothetical protein
VINISVLVCVPWEDRAGQFASVERHCEACLRTIAMDAGNADRARSMTLMCVGCAVNLIPDSYLETSVALIRGKEYHTAGEALLAAEAAINRN